MRNSNRVALVTGAAGDLGRANCVRFSDGGASVIALGRPAPDQGGDLTRTLDEIRAAGGEPIAARADVSDRRRLQIAVDKAVAEAGGLDVVVANAAVYQPVADVNDLEDQHWTMAVDVNLIGVWNTIQVALPHLSTRGSGAAVVVVGSTSGVRGQSGAPQYSATKHGLVGLVRSLVEPLGARGIRINIVHPGAVGTSLVRGAASCARLRPDLADPGEEDIKPLLASRNVLGIPWVEPEDVSESVSFLASDRARYITGAELVVDAGSLHR